MRSLAGGIEIPFPQQDIHVRSLLGLDQEEARALLNGRPIEDLPSV